MLKMCLNWKVLAGLGAVGAAIFLVAPNLVLGALPVLLLAACPLSMLVMMWGMHQSQHADAGQQLPQAKGAVLSGAEQLAQLRTRLEQITAQQTTLAQQIEHLQATEVAAPSGTTLQEAVPVALAGEGRR